MQHVSLFGSFQKTDISEVETKMTTVSETDTSLATQCLDFCQALAGQGKEFKLSITIGSTFTFSLDTRKGKETLPKKRSSPSTLKRNAKRREEFIAKKSESEAASLTGLESNQKLMKQLQAFKCNQCESSFKTENGLKIHTGKSHKEANSPEKLRKSISQSSLTDLPLHLSSREEDLENGEIPLTRAKCFECDGCDESFDCEADLTSHTDVQHPLKCHICSKWCKDDLTRRQHHWDHLKLMPSN